jgi:hypothetical protein
MPRRQEPERTFEEWCQLVPERGPIVISDDRLARDKAIRLWSDPRNKLYVLEMHDVVMREFLKTRKRDDKAATEQIKKAAGPQHHALMDRLGNAVSTESELVLKGLSGFAHGLIIAVLAEAIVFRNNFEPIGAMADKKAKKPRVLVRRDVSRARKEALQNILRIAAQKQTPLTRHVENREDLDSVVALACDTGTEVVLLDELDQVDRDAIIVATIGKCFHTLGDAACVMANALSQVPPRRRGRAPGDRDGFAQAVVGIWSRYGFAATHYRAAADQAVARKQRWERQGFERVLQLAGEIVGLRSKEGVGDSAARRATSSQRKKRQDLRRYRE